jgi:hypothetical protein
VLEFVISFATCDVSIILNMLLSLNSFSSVTFKNHVTYDVKCFQLQAPCSLSANPTGFCRIFLKIYNIHSYQFKKSRHPWPRHSIFGRKVKSCLSLTTLKICTFDFLSCFVFFFVFHGTQTGCEPIQSEFSNI